MKHLYIHIPFCHRRCTYCDFNTYATIDHRIEPYVAALVTELGLLATSVVPTPPVSAEAAALRPTIFIGGGTPTMLSLKQMERLLTAADKIVALAGAEVTCEANPGTVIDREYLRGLRQLGINRLSMGVQSLNDVTLRVLGRIHTADEARRSYAQAREAGFENINLDFMFGLPNQTPAQWSETLAEIIPWQAEHISLYALILEEQTPLYAQVMMGQVQIPDDDAGATMYEAAMEQCAAAGYLQYEISNFARTTTPLPPSGLPHWACEHNVAYWLNSDYIAAGAGAYGHITSGENPQRYFNLITVDSYIRAIETGQRPIAEIIPLGRTDIEAETMMMGLRLNRGVGATHFAARCGSPLDVTYGEQIAGLMAQGLIERVGERVRLTPRGRMIGNQVFQRFL